MPSQIHSHPVIDSSQPDVDEQNVNSLWRISVLIMAIVFGPAMLAWALTLIH